MDFVLRLILCFIFPPLAVFDKGCGAILLVILLTLFHVIKHIFMYNLPIKRRVKNEE